MADVTSKSTPCFKAHLPTVASTGPSMVGWLFQVIVFSPHEQLLMAWSCPPELLLEPVAEATCRCSLAEWTGCLPTPVTLMRRKVRLMGLASAVSTLLAPEFVVGLPAFTRASALTVATGAAGGHTGGGPPTQAPPAHRSAVVQGLRSSHSSVFGVPAHTPAAQVSPDVQGLRSSRPAAASSCCRRSGARCSPSGEPRETESSDAGSSRRWWQVLDGPVAPAVFGRHELASRIMTASVGDGSNRGQDRTAQARVDRRDPAQSPRSA